MAPPITLDIMTLTPWADPDACKSAPIGARHGDENIAQRSVQQGDASQPKQKQVRFAEHPNFRSRFHPIPP
jgi:hypothetical protein